MRVLAQQSGTFRSAIDLRSTISSPILWLVCHDSPRASGIPIPQSSLRPVVRHILLLRSRSEERRVGKECTFRWWPCHFVKKQDRKIVFKERIVEIMVNYA